ncbi:MAG: hypothetical protein Q4F81_08880 [Eubacteriales bacterium]|nr:hypothetical protein [Eubacteriales bacterium]
MLQQLQERYRHYDEEANLVRKKASPADGLFGFGNDPKNHPCHETFYEDVGKWTKAFLASGPDPEQSFEAARFLIAAPKECSGKESYWMMYAAQGWCRELVCRLDADGCRKLREVFDELYPKRDRMPVQQELYKALKKGESKR